MKSAFLYVERMLPLFCAVVHCENFYLDTLVIVDFTLVDLDLTGNLCFSDVT